jgi:hypothetical protein
MAIKIEIEIDESTVDVVKQVSEILRQYWEGLITTDECMNKCMYEIGIHLELIK